MSKRKWVSNGLDDQVAVKVDNEVIELSDEDIIPVTERRKALSCDSSDEEPIIDVAVRPLLQLQPKVEGKNQTRLRRSSTRITAKKKSPPKKDENNSRSLPVTLHKRTTRNLKVISDEDTDESLTPQKSPEIKKKKSGKTSGFTKQDFLAVFGNEDENRKLSEYELIRQRNIEERMRLFHELKLDEAVEDVKKEFKKAAPVKKQPNKFSKPKSPLPPRRKSLRIEGIQAEAPLREAARARAASLTSMPAHYSADWGDKQRNNNKVLSLEEVLLPNFTYDECKVWLAEDCQKINREPIPDILKTCSIGEFKEIMQGLTLKEHHKLKVVPDRIYSLAFHPTYQGIMVAAGSKSGVVGLWSTNLEYQETDKVQLSAFNHHVRPANCVTFGETEANILYTTSYDGTSRRGDLESGKFTLIYSTDENERDSHLAWHCELSPGVLLIGQGNGGIAQVDTREPQENATMFKCHDRSVRTISIHPMSKQHIATTSSTRRVVGLWDLRKMSSKKAYLGQLASLEFEKPLSAAFFSPISGNKLLTTSYDNNISVFCSADLSVLNLLQKVHHNNHTGRWITNFKVENIIRMWLG
ncbi:hypothetical protein B566_EDAN007970 [Ephemera danica]|nr:hypothetical protein B566_EDAN007970 [Ephemera danica]